MTQSYDASWEACVVRLARHIQGMHFEMQTLVDRIPVSEG